MPSPSEQTDFSKLVPEIAEWNNGQGVSIDCWLESRGDFKLAIGFSRLFWPAFLEHDGCVFLGDGSLEYYEQWMKKFEGDRSKVEGMMNHRHMLDLFHHDSDSATAEQLDYLGNVLREAWEAKLARDFPVRKFTVTFDRGSADDVLGYIVTFWQPANSLAG